MKNTILFILSFYLSIHSFAQNSFPSLNDSPKWYVYEAEFAFGPDGYETNIYQYEKDTLLCGQIYSKVDIEINLSTNYSPFSFTRVEGDKVFYRPNGDCSLTEKIIYDFGLDIGDSVYCAFYATDSILFWVDTIEVIDYLGVNRKKFSLESSSKVMTWIEGVGCTLHPFYPSVCLIGNCESWQKLVCMDSSSTRVYHDSFYPNCGLAAIDENTIEFQKDFVFPNPSFGVFNFKTNPNIQINSIKLFDLMGKEITEVKFNQEQIDLSNLAKGTYLLHVELDSGSFCSKLVLE